MLFEISKTAFAHLQRLFHEASGIDLSADKQMLVQTRLSGRVDALGLSSFDAYCAYLAAPPHGDERRLAIELLTTNETYFFREPSHFVQLANQLTTRFKGQPVRVWSAACATGEEAYSIAMTMLDHRPEGSWELRASDLSTRALERARLGIYPLARLENIPPGYMKRFCLRGTGDHEGSLRVDDAVRTRVTFFAHNLLHDARQLGTFEVIFVRNVLIYFEFGRRQEILSRLVDRLRPGGLLFLGHAEPLQGLVLPIHRIAPAVFEKL